MPQDKIHRTKAQLAAAKRAIKLAGGVRGMALALLPKKYERADYSLMYTRVRAWNDRVGVPPRWVSKVNDITGVSRHAMAPDVFRKDD